MRKIDGTEYLIIKLSERQDLIDKAAQWYHSKWKVPLEAYRESIEDSFDKAVPSWYLCMDGEEIIAGMGVIENDFHERKDLAPNVVAVFTEPQFRNRGIAREIINYVCEDMNSYGIDTLYLITDHIGLYERYGWEFLTMVKCDDSDNMSRMYVHHAHP